MHPRNNIQLLPENRRRVDIKNPGSSNLFILGVIVLSAIIGISLLLHFRAARLERSLSTVNEEIMALEKSRDKNLEKELLVFKKQLSLISGVLDNHIHWTNAMTRIESLLQAQTQFKTLTLDTTGARSTLEVNALAPSYTVIAKQLAAFISDVDITDVLLKQVKTTPAGKVEFSLQLDFDTNKYLKK